MPSRPWHGWSSPDARRALPTAAARLLAEELGICRPPTRPVALADVRLPEPRLDGRLRGRLAAVVGEDGVCDDRAARVQHAGGSSYVDLVRLRAGMPSDAPDAVVSPATHDEVRSLLELCSSEQITVVPVGGGTSVVGGLAPIRDGFRGIVALDLGRMDRLEDVDRIALVATLQPGLTGTRAEALLGAHGLTLGHFPQSFEHATIGGFLATRSAGQASTGYGRIDALVEGLRVATPVGDLDLGRAPASAAGPDLRALLVGSEGTLGVITEARLRVRRAPAERRDEGWSLPSFEAGCTVLRLLAQAGLAPDIARLSDPAETRLALAQAGAKASVLRGYRRARGHGGGCLLIAGWEGVAPVVAWRRRHAARALRRHGGVPLGQAVGAAWRRDRFGGPYLRDTLLDHGALVETLETATHWGGLRPLYETVRAALLDAFARQGGPAVVLCHVSHLYATGASLYFTVFARAEPGREITDWQAAKRAASEAIVAAGGTITHHHAVGTDHRPWMRAEIGGLGVDVLRAVKARLDPAGIMNPGKLIPDDR